MICVTVRDIHSYFSFFFTYFSCIRRRRMRRAAQQAKQAPYTPGNIAPVGDKSVMKGFLGLDFSPEVFISSETPYKKLQEENARI